MTVTTKLSKQGQISIPKKFIKLLNLNLDQLIDLSIVDNKIVINKKENPVTQFIGILKGKTNITSQEFIKLRKKEAKL